MLKGSWKPNRSGQTAIVVAARKAKGVFKISQKEQHKMIKQAVIQLLSEALGLIGNSKPLTAVMELLALIASGQLISRNTKIVRVLFKLNKLLIDINLDLLNSINLVYQSAQCSLRRVRYIVLKVKMLKLKVCTD